MKKIIFISLLAVIGLGKVSAQTVTDTITYTGAVALGCCKICGADFWCFNCPSVSCFTNTAACGTKRFLDPVPTGSIITGITLYIWSAHCTGGSIDITVGGCAFPTVWETSSGCLCSSTPCAMTDSVSAIYPCGMSCYIYGDTNSLTLCTGMDVAMQRIVIKFTYAPSNESTPPAVPGAISGISPLCKNSSQTYSIAAVTGANKYTWTVPAGWTINSGQGTTSINATAGATTGNVCVTPSNLCGSSGPACFSVTVNPTPVAPDSISVNPDYFYSGTVTVDTLTAIGGSGTTLNWYAGSCGGVFVGSGTRIIIPPPTDSTSFFASWTNGCGTSTCDTATVIVYPLTGIEEINNNAGNIAVYPNPPNDNITIDIVSLTKGESISIYDIQGQLILQQPLQHAKTNINISTLAKGVYFVKVKTENGMEVKKIVKE